MEMERGREKRKTWCSVVFGGGEDGEEETDRVDIERHKMLFFGLLLNFQFESSY